MTIKRFVLWTFTSGLVIEVFDDLFKVGADVVLLHGCPQSCMPNPVEGLLEVYEDMVEVLLVLEIPKYMHWLLATRNEIVS